MSHHHPQSSNATKRHSGSGGGENYPTKKRYKYTEDGGGGGGGNASLVADHYNSLKNTSKVERKNSKIYYMRNFNNWIKSTVIRKYIDIVKRDFGPDHITALDLGAGKGGDLLKWEKGRIGRLVCTDLAVTSVEQCQERYNKLRSRSRGRIFDAEFIACDSTKEMLKDKFRDSAMQFHMTSCQFVMHYAFESESQAETMVRNACSSIREGGFLIGSTVNEDVLLNKLQRSKDLSFGNDVINVTFDSKDSFPDFGCKYMFKLHDVVDCPEFLLRKKIFVKLCEKYGMRLLEWKPFSTFFYENIKDRENFRLIQRMKALETFPPLGRYEKLNSDVEGDYDHARKECDRLHAKYPNSNPQVATISKTEWEAASIYVVYVFVKDKSYVPNSSSSDNSEASSDGKNGTAASAAQFTESFERIPMVIL